MTYEGLSAAYPAMTGDSGAPSDFIEQMNSIPKYMASRTLRGTGWNATVIEGDVATFVADLKRQPGGNIIKYGNGPLDVTFMEHGLIDEFHLLMTPVAVGRGQHMFEAIEGGPACISSSDAVQQRSRDIRLHADVASAWPECGQSAEEGVVRAGRPRGPAWVFPVAEEGT